MFTLQEQALDGSELGYCEEDAFIDFADYKNTLDCEACLFWNYRKLASWDILHEYVNRLRTTCYFIVFKPLNINYSTSFDGMDHVRKKLANYKRVIITREITASKIHYNALVESYDDLLQFHNKHTSRYMMHVQIVPKTWRNLHQVHEYITKESHNRRFRSREYVDRQQPLDLYVSARRNKNIVQRYYNDACCPRCAI